MRIFNEVGRWCSIPCKILTQVIYVKKIFINPLKRIRVIIRTPTHGRTDGRTDRQMDGRTGWIQYTPLNFVSGGIMTLIHKGTYLSGPPTWISNQMISKVWNEITYPFLNFNGCTVEVKEWISNFIPYFIMDVLTDPCWDESKTMLVKGVPGVKVWSRRRFQLRMYKKIADQGCKLHHGILRAKCR